jgi:hypothetical protein
MGAPCGPHKRRRPARRLSGATSDAFEGSLPQPSTNRERARASCQTTLIQIKERALCRCMVISGRCESPVRPPTRSPRLATDPGAGESRGLVSISFFYDKITILKLKIAH